MRNTARALNSNQGESLRRRKLEFRGLILATVLVTLGLLWVYWAQTGAISHTPEDSKVVNLSQVNDPSDLIPALSALQDKEREKHLAKRIATYLRERADGQQSALSKVGDLDEATAPDGSQLLSGREYRTLRSSFVVRSASAYGWEVLRYGLLFLLSFFLVHVYWRVRWGRLFGRKGRIFGGDPTLLPMMMLLTGVGLALMISLRDPLREPLIFTDFAVGILLGCTVLAVTAKTFPPFPRRWFRSTFWVNTGWFLSLITCFFIFLVLLFLGEGPSGTRINLNLGFIQFQPVELVKVIFVFFVAGFFARFDDHFRELKNERIWELIGTVILSVVIILGFFLGIKELGSALILALTFFSLYAVARRGVVIAILGFICVIAGFYFGYLLDTGALTIFGYSPDVGAVSDRLRMWMSPWNNYAKYGDHLAHMLWAFAHGGLTGAGLGSEGIDFIPLAYTDAILAAAAEQLGALGMVLIGGLYFWFFHRCFGIARRVQSTFNTFLAAGLTLLLVVELIIIAGGVSGITPLTGVVTPFLSYGKTSMIANLFIVGILVHLSSAGPQSSNPYDHAVEWLEWVSMGVFVLILARILFVQLVNTQDTLASPAKIPHSTVVQDTVAMDGSLRTVRKRVFEKRRYSFNPRLTSLADRLGRGPIYDRNGIPLATSQWDSVRAYHDVYERLGVNLDRTVHSSDSRYYPFGEFTYHLLGDIRSRHQWFADNTAFVERERRTHLLGYDDEYSLDTIEAVSGDSVLVPYRNYRPLVPLLQSDWRRNMFLEKDRSIQLTVDIQLQQRVSQILENHLQKLGRLKAAVVVLNVETGGLLASVTHPWKGALEDKTGQGASLDRARFGLYPPGSAFKIVTAAAALRMDESLYRQRYPFSANRCRRFGREKLNMEQAVICSSNDYFSSLAEEKIGPVQLLETAAEFDIQVARPNNPDSLQYVLDQAAFGQGEVTATPLEMARVAASIARGGQVPSTHWVESKSQEWKRILSGSKARRLGTYMRQVVTHPAGTAHNIASPQTGYAGKTGTAQKEGQRPFAWYIGYAPSDMESQQIAVAVLIEEGGSGAGAAAPVAADVFRAAQDLGY